MVAQSNRNRLYFGAGPAKLPKPVLDTMHTDMFNIADTNLSIFELSHRTKEYEQISQRAVDGICRLMSIDKDEYAVLLVPGGATLQFAASVLNMVCRMDGDTMITIDYLITGHWSEKAAEEAELLGLPVRRVECVSRVIDPQTGNHKHVITLPRMDTLSDLVYYCQNETIDGVEVPELVPSRPTQHLLCDASSNILSRPVNIRNYAVLFAGAQKNVGVAGVTIVIAKRATCVTPLLKQPLASMLDYHKHEKCRSIYNTPPMVAVYGTALVVEWLERQFGTLHAVDSYSQRKAAILYSMLALDQNTNGKKCALYCPVEPVNMRSRINVVLRLQSSQKAVTDTDIIQSAARNGIEGIQGHRTAGGLRVSLYNSVTVEEVEELRKFLEPLIWY